MNDAKRRFPADGAAWCLLAAVAAAAGSAAGADPHAGNRTQAGEGAYASTYRPAPREDLAIVGATLLTGAGPRIENGTILLRDGRVAAVGPRLAVPAGIRAVDARGKWVTPGIVDPHVHLGTQIRPGNESTNELTHPNSANVWIEHGVWPQDPGFAHALAAGVTTMQILPGSGNLFGGRAVTVHPVPATTVAAMKFPGAPQGLKMACGENPARIYGAKGQAPMTVMGDVAGYREAWAAARAYDREWTAYEAAQAAGRAAMPPKRDLRLDTLRDVLRGKIAIHMHCYRADEMATAIAVAHEFGFRIASFHHAVEAYKIAPLLAEEGICAAVWAQTGAAKMEMSDVIPENAALLQRAGACVMMHSDGPSYGERLALEASIAMAAGNRAGIRISHEDAIRWLTLEPARSLGIADRTGSLEPGKAADLVLWDRDPFSVYARPEQVLIDGAVHFDRARDGVPRPSDLELGRRLGGAE